MLTRKEVLSAYNVNDKGVITSPGKFEGEFLYVPAFWDEIMNGFGEEYEEDGVLSSRLIVEEDDLKEFPELGSTKAVVLWETDQGFVMCAEEE